MRKCLDLEIKSYAGQPLSKIPFWSLWFFSKLINVVSDLAHTIMEHDVAALLNIALGVMSQFRSTIMTFANDVIRFLPNIFISQFFRICEEYILSLVYGLAVYGSPTISKVVILLLFYLFIAKLFSKHEA